MSKEWIKFSMAGGKGPIYINTMYATAVFAQGKGARISFVGDAEDHTDVEESPEIVMAMLKGWRPDDTPGDPMIDEINAGLNKGRNGT